MVQAGAVALAAAGPAGMAEAGRQGREPSAGRETRSLSAKGKGHWLREVRLALALTQAPGWVREHISFVFTERLAGGGSEGSSHQGERGMTWASRVAPSRFQKHLVGQGAQFVRLHGAPGR